MRGHINRHYFLIIPIILYYRHYLKVNRSGFLLLLLGLLLLLLLLINFYFCDSCSGWRSCRRSFWSTLWWTVQIWNVKHMEFPEVSGKVSRSWHMESYFPPLPPPRRRRRARAATVFPACTRTSACWFLQCRLVRDCTSYAHPHALARRVQTQATSDHFLWQHAPMLRLEFFAITVLRL